MGLPCFALCLLVRLSVLRHPEASCLNVLYGMDVASSREHGRGLNSIFSRNLIHGGQSIQENIVLWLAAHGITLLLLPAATEIHKMK